MSTTMIATPDLHDLVKEAMEGTASKVDISAEASRQLANVGQELPGHTKTASAEEELPEHLPTEYIYKLAGALDHMAKIAEGTTKIQPGKGPNALEVLEATSSEENIDAGGMGEAKTKIPVSPAMTSSGVAKDSSNAMDENSEMSHPEQPVDPMHNEKTSAALYARNLAAVGLGKEAFAVTEEGHKYDAASAKVKSEAAEKQTALAQKHKGAGHRKKGGGTQWGSFGKALRGFNEGDSQGTARHQAYVQKKHEGGKNAYNPLGGTMTPTKGESGGSKWMYGKVGGDKKKDEGKKEASANLYARNLMALGLFKQAEDALAPASISSGSTQTGATPPEGASPSEESVPSEPSDVTSQKSMLSSNQAAIDYKKVKAKADPKKDMGHVVSEPALTASTDATLKKTLDHTSEAGAKIAADLMKTAAAQAILTKLAEEAADKKKGKKEKNSMLDDPAGQSGFTASNTGPQQA